MISRESLEAFDRHVGELSKDSPDGSVSVMLHLYTRARYHYERSDRVGDGWAVLDVYEDGKRPIESYQASIDAGARRFVFERVVVPYEQMALLRTSARRPAGEIGFGRQRLEWFRDGTNLNKPLRAHAHGAQRRRQCRPCVTRRSATMPTITDLSCLRTVQTRTSWIWHLHYALTELVMRGVYVRH